MANTTRRITIQDIARYANVSVPTVSRVLNASGYVSDGKRQAVLAAVNELNYRPNVIAQGLASGQSLTIGVLTQLIATPIYDLILRGVVETLYGTGYSPLIADGSWMPKREREAIQTFLDRSVDGLILLGGSLPHEDIIQVAAKLPTVVIARNVPELGCQSLQINDFEGGYLATRHLIEAGHRRIAHIRGIMEHMDAGQRWHGYLKALEEAGISADPNLMVQGDFTESSGVIGVEMLLTRGASFSAIFASNDQMAYGAHLALHRRGIRVPDDVSLVGFDDLSYTAYMTPPLTSIGVPALEIGQAASQGLLNLIQGKPCDMPPIPLRLIIRESVARR